MGGAAMKHECSICGKTYAKKAYLIMHIKRIHPVEYKKAVKRREDADKSYMDMGGKLDDGRSSEDDLQHGQGTAGKPEPGTDNGDEQGSTDNQDQEGRTERRDEGRGTMQGKDLKVQGDPGMPESHSEPQPQEAVPEKPNETDDYGCMMCGNTVEKNQEQCDFCGTILEWADV